jgi:serine/threonine protein kinase
VRLIDHITGAIYFLQHYDIPHGAIRPSCVLLDHEGKYLLVDRSLFLLPSNYHLALSQSSEKSSAIEETWYLAPEWIH